MKVDDKLAFADSYRQQNAGLPDAPDMNTSTPVVEPSGQLADAGTADPDPVVDFDQAQPADDAADPVVDFEQPPEEGDLLTPLTPATPEEERQREFLSRFQAAHEARTDPALDKKVEMRQFADRARLPVGAIEGDFEGIKASWEASQQDAHKWALDNPILAKKLVELSPEMGAKVIETEGPFKRFLHGLSDIGGWISRSADHYNLQTPEDEFSSAIHEQVTRAFDLPNPKPPEAPPPGEFPALMPEPRSVEKYLSSAASGHWWEKVGAASSDTGADIGLSLLWAEKAMGRGGPEIDKDIQAKEIDSFPRAYAPSNLFEEVAVESAKLAPSVGLSAIPSLAAAAGTFALTKKPKAARWAGAVVGGAANFMPELGSSYRDFSHMTTDDGTPISDNIARPMAFLYATLSTAIEMGMEPELHFAGPLGDLMKSGDRAAFFKAAAADKGAMRLAKEIFLKWNAGAIGEAGQEVGQNAVQFGLGWGATSLQAKQAQRFDVGELALQSFDTLTSTYLGSIGLAPVTAMTFGAAHLYSSMQEHKAAVAERMQAEASDLGAQRVKVVLNFANEGSETVKLAPEMMADLVKEATAKTGDPVTNLYVEPARVEAFFQAQKVDTAEGIAKLMGEDGPRKFAEAKLAGEKLEIPVATYFDKWVNDPINGAVQEHLTSAPDHKAAAQIQAEDKSFSEDVKKLADQFEKEGLTEETPKAEKDFFNRLQLQLETSKRYTPDAAKKIVAMNRAVYRVLAERSGQKVEDFIAKNDLVVAKNGRVVAQPKSVSLGDPAKVDPDLALLDEAIAQMPEAATPEAPAQGPEAVAAAAENIPASPTEENASKAGENIPQNIPATEDDSFDVGALDKQAEPLPRNEIAPGRYEVDTEQFSKAQALISRMKSPENQAQARAWLDYVARKTDKQPKMPNVELHRQLWSMGFFRPEDSILDSPFSNQQMGITGPGSGKKRNTAPSNKKPTGIKTKREGGGYYESANAEMLRRYRESRRFGQYRAKGGKLYQTKHEGTAFGDVLAEHEERISKEPNEHGVAFLPSGHVLFTHTSGFADSIHFTDNQVELMREQGDATLTHNHPLGGAFSAHDIILAMFANLKEVRAVAPDGSAVRLERPALGWGVVPSDLGQIERDLEQALAVGVARTEARVFKLIDESVDHGDATDALDKQRWTRIGREEVVAAFNDFAKRQGFQWRVEIQENPLQRVHSGRLDAGIKADGKEADDLRRAGSETLAALVEELDRRVRDQKQTVEQALDAIRANRQAELEGAQESLDLTGEDGSTDASRSRLAALRNARDEAQARLDELDQLTPNRLSESRTLFHGTDEVVRGWVTWAQEGARRTYKIFMTKHANLSTFLHENGHVYLDMLERLAGEQDAPAELKAMFQTSLDWMGVKGDWSQMTHEERREYHEKFARGFEAYLLEGKAPSHSLAGVFEAFKLWLSNIYRSVRDLDVELNDDIRGVFDRILATDDEIASVREGMNLKPLFRSPDEAGMNPEEWQAYLAAQEKARSTVETQARLRAMKDRSRELTRWWKSESKKHLDQALVDFEKRPDVRAMRFLKTGEMVHEDGTQTQHGEKGKPQKLDREAVQRMLGDKFEQLKRLTVDATTGEKTELDEVFGASVEEGLNPDEVAERFGFPTGGAMLEALLAIPDGQKWAAAEAQARMEAAHPGLLQDRKTLREGIEKGFHGKHTEEWFIEELQALRRKVNAVGAPVGEAAKVRKQLSELRKAMKEKTAPADAEQQEAALSNRLEKLNKQLGTLGAPVEDIAKAAALSVSRQEVRKLDSGRAYNLQGIHSRKATQAAAKGNFALALTHMEQHLWNFYRYQEVLKARDERTAFVDLASDLKERKSRERLGKASPVYRDGADGILEALGLRDAEASREKPLAGLGEVIAKMEADGQTVGFNDTVLRDVLDNPRPWKALTVDEMREVTLALKGIRQAARNLTTAIVDGKRMDKEQVVAHLINEALTNEKSRGQLPSSVSAATLGQRLASGWSAFDGALLKPEVMAGWLGGGSVNSMWNRAVVEPLQAGKAREVDLLNKTVKPILEKFDDIPKSIRDSLNDKVDGAALFPTHAVKSGQNIAAPTRVFEILFMALNSGNESNLQRLTNGRNITEEQVVNAIDKHLSKEAMEWVQTVWDAAESLKPEAFALEERDSGIAPQPIPARPLQTKFGTFRGGYFPAMYDKRVELAGERQVANSIAQFMDPSFNRGSTAQGHLKSRANEFAGAISLEPGNLPRHLAQVVHDIAFREAVKSVGGLLLDPAIQATMKDRLDEGRAKHFVQWVKDVGQMRGVGGFEHAGWFIKTARQIKANTVIAALGYAIPNMLEDVTNLAAAIPRADIKTKHMAAAMAEFMASPREVSDMAHEKSGELRTRRDQLQRELQGQMKNITGSQAIPVKALQFMKKHAFILMETSDWATSTPVWLAAYRQAERSNVGEAEAVKIADQAVRKVFPSHSAVDMAAVLRDKGFIGTSLRFYGFLSTYYNGLRDMGHGFSQASGVERAAIGGKIVGYFMAVSLLSEFIRGRGREPGEDYAEWFLRKSLAGALSAVPFGGDVANAIEGRLLGRRTNPRAASLPGVAIDATEAAWSALTSDKPASKKLGDGYRAAAPVLSIPSAQFGRTASYLTDLATGEQSVSDPFDFLGGVIYGKRKGQPENPASVVSDVVSGGARR